MNIRVATIHDLANIEKLAREIWPGTYGQILSPDQIEYMLQLFYSQTSLEKQMLQEHHQFLLVEWEEQPVGFADYSLYAPGVYKLHKIYVHASMQGKGLGKALICYVINKVKGHTLRLNVNRYNKARYFYEKLGFVITSQEDIDIGNGYYMNDYVMEITPAP
jgi:N-acetylglutamate synthase and related acetyltransferases